MKRAFLLGGACAVAPVCWFSLEPWIPERMLRVYAAFPVAAVLLFVAYAHARAVPWREAAKTIGTVLMFAVGITVFRWILVVASHRAPYWFVRSTAGSEFFFWVYFLISVCVGFALLHWAVKGSCCWLDARCFGPAEEDAALPWGRRAIREAAPLLLMLPVVLPYVIAVAHIYPMKCTYIRDPAHYGRAYENVEFETADGYTLRGWFIPVAEGKSDRTLLICHGVGTNREGVLAFVRLGNALDANCLLFDFRGHGESDGRGVSFGKREWQDAAAAIRYLRSERKEQAREIIGMGLSMGTSALIPAAAAADPPLDAVICDSPFSSSQEMSWRLIQNMPAAVQWWVHWIGIPIANCHAECNLLEIRPIDHVAELDAPVLFVHAEGDRLIPAEHSRKLYAQAREPKQLWISDAPVHGQTFAKHREEYLRRVLQLIEEDGREAKASRSAGGE